MLTLQKDKFSLPQEVTYLNGAYMSPQLKKVEQVGIAALQRKSQPYTVGPDEFFDDAAALKQQLSILLDIPHPADIALVPSVSYGMANIANNVHLEKGDEIILLDAQFPSNVYAWQKVAQAKGAQIRIIKAPELGSGRAAQWNQNILDAIHSKTAVISLPPCHWADGTLFELDAIREKTKQYGALMVIDGSQSFGAAPFAVSQLQPDAVVGVGYKWLLGPYSLGFAYMGPYFHDGEPIENNWINRAESEDFSQLVNYNAGYQPRAGRYNMGEYSNFNLVPMLSESVKQLIDWSPSEIQSYCSQISKAALEKLRELGCFIEEDAHRASHIFGIYLPKHLDIQSLKSTLFKDQIFVSYRGEAIRVSPNVYNTAEDFDRFIAHFKTS